jgi:hypothetical protein
MDEQLLFSDAEVKMLGGKKMQMSKTPLTILKRPSGAKTKKDSTDDDSEKLEEEALAKLELFCKDGDLKVFDGALKRW